MTNPNPAEKTALVSPKPYSGAYRAELDKPDELEAPENKAADEANPEDQNVDDLNLPPEEKTYKKRYGDLRRFADKKVQELKAEVETLKRAREHAENNGYKPPKTKEELEAWLKEYPDVGGIVKTIAYEEAAKQSKVYETKITELEKTALQLRQEKALAQIEKAHPEFLSLKETEKFHEWAQSQPKHIQAWLYDNFDDATLVIRAVDLYKLDTGVTKKANSESRDRDRSAAAEAVKGPKVVDDPTKSGKKIWKGSEIARLTTREYEKFEAEIDLAVREGRVDMNS